MYRNERNDLTSNKYSCEYWCVIENQFRLIRLQPKKVGKLWILQNEKYGFSTFHVNLVTLIISVMEIFILFIAIERTLH